jgi:tetratricopeptide (TPR) repeat protein
MLVCAIDPTSSMALVHMANHCSHTWKLVSGAPKNRVVKLLAGGTTVALRREEAKDLSVGDHISINFGPNTYSVSKIDVLDNDVIQVELDGVVSVEDDDIRSGLTVEAKEFGRSFKLASEAISLTSDRELKAEAYYIMGKVHHMQGRAEKALACYRKSLAESEFMLSAFGAAQIQLSRHELASAYDLFERVLKEFPDDKDTKAYFYLVKAMHKKELTPMEQLKDVCFGFQFEADSWMLQGQLRLENPSEFHSALKCLTNAMECIEKKGESLDSLLLSNIAVLHHSLGRCTTAVEYGQRALISLENELTSVADNRRSQLLQNPPFRSAELDGVMYSWIKLDCEVSFDGDGHFIIKAGGSASTVDVSDAVSGIFVGADVVIDDILHKVTAVHSPVCFDATSLVPLPRVPAQESAGADQVVTHAVKVKHLWHNFTDAEVTMAFNFARMLEDVGSTSASMEIYVELLKRHPSYMECRY